MQKYGLKDNVGLIVVLRARTASPQAASLPTGVSSAFEQPPATALQGPAVAIANTHLLFNPKRGDIKVGPCLSAIFVTQS